METAIKKLLVITLGVIGCVCIGWGIHNVVQSNSEISNVPNTPIVVVRTPDVSISPLAQVPKKLYSGMALTTYNTNASNFLENFSDITREDSLVTGLHSNFLRPANTRYYVFQGYFHAEQAGQYTFKANTDGTVRFDLGGTTLLEAYQLTDTTVTVYLTAGYYDLSVHAFGEVALSCNVTFGGNTKSISECLFYSTEAQGLSLSKLRFLTSDNNGLICDITASLSGNEFTCLLPPGVSIDNLVPAFTATGKVFFGDTEAVSGQTAVDISSRSITVTNSNGSKKVYTFSARVLATDLPCISITSSAAITSKNNYVDAVAVIHGGNATYGADLQPTKCSIKIRGNYSSGLEKKPYTLKFDKKTSVLDLTPEKSWVMIASHLDLSQMRNYTAYEIAKAFDGTEFVPRMRFVDVFVNGNYRGLYLLGDKIDISSTRFTLDQKSTEPDIGVIMELEKDFRAEGKKGYDYFVTPQGWCVTFKDPDADELTSEQRKYIANYFIAAESAIMAGTGYEEYIDVDSFIDWYLVETLFKNCDSDFTSSIYFHKEKGGKLKMGPVWDFDSGLGNHEGFPELLEPTGWEPRWGTYLEPLMNDPAFRKRMSARWFEKRDAVEGYFALVDETTELIRKSYNENFKVYNILQNGIAPVPPYVYNRKSIDGQADFMKTWIRQRIDWLNVEFAKTNY